MVSPVIINIAWYFNYGIEGPVPWLFIAFLAYLILVWDNKRILIFIFVVISNLSLLYFIESGQVVNLGNYPSHDALLIDNYLGIVVVLMITYAYLSAAKQNYLRQYRKAKESDELKSAFLANVSHEIRTPLNAIVGLSNYLLDEDISMKEREEYKKIIFDNGTYLSTLINDIIDVSKLESNLLTINKSKSTLNHLFLKLESYYQLELETLGKNLVSLKHMPLKENTIINTDIVRLEQVLRTLLNNAVKFTEKGHIKFSCIQVDGYFRFTVEDTGIGIKPEYKKMIFNRFHKMNNNDQMLYRGTGIGLFLAQKLTHILGGEIWVESTFGEGSAFYFNLPVN
ncbi:MAG: hypothetical protein JEZ03_09585 [Bacteroidales bacterium]|nr:hypothetical protein [Bacteroidales bacterium]